MDVSELKQETLSMLHALSVKGYEELSVSGGLSQEFVIKDFGVVVSVLKVEDIVFVRNKLAEAFKDWRVVYITTDDDLVYKKDELLYELMRCGYLKWIRLTYPSQFNRVVHTTDLGSKIIRKRLEIWGDRPKYTFLIEDNKDALKNPSSYVMSLDSGFFDYMPEVE